MTVETVDRPAVKPFRTVIRNGDELEMRVSMHKGQARVWKSVARIVCVLAGSQIGKTVLIPHWLKREMERRGPGDYILGTSTFKLLENKLLPEFLEVFKNILNLGEYQSSKGIFEISKRGETLLWGAKQQEPTRVLVFSGQSPKGAEAATAKAAALDEVGQEEFLEQTYEAIERRVNIHQGRILLTTCYDDKTEIYTEDGWKLIGELNDGDKVYAPDKMGSGVFEKPYARTWEPYKGKMFHFSGGRIDLCVTPNHRILYRNGKHFYIKDAEHFNRLQHRYLCIPKIINPQLPNKGYFTLPEIEKGHRWGKLVCPEIKILMADWCAFMGWFLSEGCTKGVNGGNIVNGGYKVYCSQSPGKGQDLLYEDLRKLPFKWSLEGISFTTSNKQLWSYLKPLGNCSRKYIPQEIKHSGKDNLLILIDRLVKGDGSFHKDNWFSYYTTSPRLASDFREVCMLAGISTGMKLHESKPFQGTNGNFKPIYHIWGRKRKSGIVQECEELDYEGYIGCVGTSTGLVLVRRNGEECICGNTLYNFGWLKRRIYDEWVRGDKYIDVIQLDSIENPAFPLESWERAKKTLPPWKFDLFYRGRYTRPAGMVYDCFDSAAHCIPRFEIPIEWPRYVGHDFGPANMAAVWIAQNPGTGDFFLYRSYLSGNRGFGDYVNDWRRLMLPGEEKSIIKRVGGLPGREDGWRESFRQFDWPILPPRIPKPELQILRCYELIKANKFFVFKDENDFIDDITKLSYKLDDENQPTDKVDNDAQCHRAAAFRYIGSEFNPDSARLWTPQKLVSVFPDRNERVKQAKTWGDLVRA